MWSNHHLQLGAARGRGGVDCLGEGMEFHAPVFEVIKHGYQVAQAAA